MSKQPILFIVGAGASIPYGYPTGAGLLAEILDDDTISAELKELLDFNEPFSIDAFLAQHCSDNEALTLEAKKLIVKHILLKEDRSKIYQKHENGWYHFLWNMLCNDLMDIVKLPKDERLAALKEKFDIPFRIITFNYDVSLDYYLLSRIWRANMLEVEEKKILLKKMNEAIVHVYGSVRDVPWDNPEVLDKYVLEDNYIRKKSGNAYISNDFELENPYKDANDIQNARRWEEQQAIKYFYGSHYIGNVKNNYVNSLYTVPYHDKHNWVGVKFIEEAVEKIKVINYERHGEKDGDKDGDIEIKEKLKPFHEVIANTSNIIFLGFGFDKTNMDLVFIENNHAHSWNDSLLIQYTNYYNSEKINRFIKNHKGLHFRKINTSSVTLLANYHKSIRQGDNAIQQALAHDFDLQ